MQAQGLFNQLRTIREAAVIISDGDSFHLILIGHIAAVAKQIEADAEHQSQDHQGDDAIVGKVSAAEHADGMLKRNTKTPSATSTIKK